MHSLLYLLPNQTFYLTTASESQGNGGQAIKGLLKYDTFKAGAVSGKFNR